MKRSFEFYMSELAAAGIIVLFVMGCARSEMEPKVTRYETGYVASEVGRATRDGRQTVSEGETSPQEASALLPLLFRFHSGR